MFSLQNSSSRFRYSTGYVFLFRRFLFHINLQSKAEKVKISELLLPLTKSIWARNAISHSLLVKDIRSFAWLYFSYSWLTSLNKMIFAL